MRERVFITGIGGISSFGVGVAPFIDALRAGSSGVAPITRFDTSTCRSHHAALVQGFDPAAYVSPLKLRRMDEVSRLALVCARQTFADARYETGGGAGEDRAGIALGTYTAGLDSTVEYLRGLIKNGAGGVPALLFSNTVSNAPASLCAIEIGLRGPNVTFNQREASALSAIAYAAGAVADGRADVMLTGAADTLVETFFKTYDLFHALSPRRAGEPEAARPFDRRRNGFVLGEAAFMLLLESGTSVAARGIRTYGEILGIGATGGRAAVNGWPQTGDAIARAMHEALRQASVASADVVAVLASANGSPDLDAVESAAIHEVFGGRPVPVASVKGAIGESSAAGAASLIAGMLGVASGQLPPTIGWGERDAACDVAVSSEPIACGRGTLLVNAVASGGACYSIAVAAV